MKTAIAAAALFGASLLAACGQAGGPDTAKVAAEVRENAQRVVSAYNSRDAARAASYDAPDYVGLFHGQANARGPEADEAGMSAQMKAAKVEWSVGDDIVKVADSGDLAVYQAPYTFTATDRESGEATVEKGTWVAIFVRQEDGSMKLWRSIATDGPPS